MAFTQYLVRQPTLSRWLVRFRDDGRPAAPAARLRPAGVPQLGMVMAALLTLTFTGFGVFAAMILGQIYQSPAVSTLALMGAGVVAVRRRRS